MSTQTAKEETTQMQQGAITPEALEKWKERIGSKMRIRNQFNELASKDAIRHFCDGIGDPNPLFRDEEYAKKTRYGSIVAPPSWLYSVFPTWVLQGLPGVHALQAHLCGGHHQARVHLHWL
jgi:acyl dehydratase